MCESLFCWCSFPPNLQLSPVFEHLDVMSTVPVDRQTFSAWDNYVDFSTEVGGGWKQRFTSTFVFFCFEFQMCLVGTQYIYDILYIYTYYSHDVYTWHDIICIHIHLPNIRIFSQHSELAGPLTKVRYQKHGSFGELFLFFSGRKWGQNCKVKRWNCSAGATAVPSREPPWEKENHLQKVPLGGDMLVFRRADVSRFFVWLNPYWSSFPNTIFQGLCLFGGV